MKIKYEKQEEDNAMNDTLCLLLVLMGEESCEKIIMMPLMERREVIS